LETLFYSSALPCFFADKIILPLHRSQDALCRWLTFQELTDPLINYKNKVLFQEFGEIALDGVLDLFKEASYEPLTQFPFWERLVREREQYLNLLISKAIAEDKESYVEIIEFVKSNSINLNAVKFKFLFEKYFNDRKLFQHLYKSLS
jgi:hypothetical protein